MEPNGSPFVEELAYPLIDPAKNHGQLPNHTNFLYRVLAWTNIDGMNVPLEWRAQRIHYETDVWREQRVYKPFVWEQFTGNFAR